MYVYKILCDTGIFLMLELSFILFRTPAFEDKGEKI